MHIFISYAKKDTRALALELREQFETVPNVTVWMDETPEIGEVWNEQLQNEIERCNVVIALISPSVNQPEPNCFVIRELNWAMRKHKPVLPVFAQATEVPPFLQGVQHFDLTENKAAVMRRLVAKVREWAGIMPVVTAPLRPYPPRLLSALDDEEEPQARQFPWWWIAAGVGIIALIIVGVLLLL